jgi:protein-S-isoprenylcysteine O-methyltransferase Ste14
MMPMEFIPELSLRWLNGWIPVLIFYIPFVILMLIWPREIVRKLYDVSGWSPFERNMSLAGKPFSLASIVLLIFAPLKLGNPVFWIGMGIYVVGYAVIFTALFNYRSTPVGEPVERGIYRFSRNPQWMGLLLTFVGAGVMTGFGMVVIFMLLVAIFYHYRIKGEERACLARYGEAYQRHLEEVPRYFASF